MYFLILILLCLGIIIGMHYRKEDNRRMFRNYILFPVCGLSMLFVDKLSFFVRGCGKSHIDYKLKKIYTKDQVSNEHYMYLVRKTAVSIVCFIGVIIIAVLFDITQSSEDKTIKVLKRPENAPAEYEFDMNDMNKRQKVNIMVAPVKHRKKEIYKKFEASYDEIVKVMLGKNISADKVKKKLVFPESYPEENINLEWSSSAPEIIDYDGKVYCSDEKKDVVIYLTMNYQGIEKDYEIPVTVMKKEFFTYEERLQKIIDSQDVHNEEVVLPVEIDGKKVSFENNKSGLKVSFLIIAIVASLLIFFLKDKEIDSQICIRERQLEIDYSEVVSKILMLTNAGMSIQMAFKKIVEDYDKRGRGKRYVYEEMRLCTKKIMSGCSETEAYNVFGRRCGLQCYVKLGSILAQCVAKGTRGVGELLVYEVTEAFENKKIIAKKNGEEAGTKMLFPMVVMLMVAIVIIVVPAFLSLG